uniref:PR/SET domain 2 n=1 Tax=Paramormyrops kingsleyae TaxID=1676925 RepID=A0A3B3SNV7_9TELE
MRLRRPEDNECSISETFKLHTGLDPGNSAEGELESSVFSCEHCERHFSTKQGLERHTHIHVSVNRRMHTFKCRYCSKPFGSQVGRRRHERRHENGPMKKMALVSGLAKSLSQLSSQSDNSGPDPAATSDSAVVNGSPSCVNPKVSSSTQKVAVMAETRRASAVDDSGESKELHPCKYCKKVFGTHTNMRRHQRRIHERHLLPKGIRKNGTLLQETQRQKQPPPEGSPDASPPPVYVPSGDVEDEGGQEEYMVDISNNISENLSLYIDGKILSTSTVSNCEVIQVDSSSVALFGLDAFIISPDQISQVLKVDTAVLISSLSSPSSSSQPTETLAFQKEKTLYLSPKLKQLLQTRDGYKPTSTLITDGHRPGPPPPMAALSAGSGRFKRRTASPPNSSQYNPVGTSKSEAVVSLGSKAPKIDNQGSSPTQSSSKDERDTASPSGTDPFKLTTEDWPNSRSVGSSCNQQPLDLSSAVSKKDEGQNKGPGEIVLDLSMHRKTSTEPEVKGSLSTQPLLKKRKPDTSVLEKVLLNEYDGLELIVSVTRQSPPPSLTPVTMHSPSPCSPAVGSPTPPPPVLPSASSPQPLSESTELQSASSPTQKSLPDLSPNISPRPLEIHQEKLSPVSEQDTNVMVQDVVNCANLYHFMCNVCEKPFCSIKELSHHISEHAEEWPFKCEFCVLLFGKADALLEHRSSLHGVGRIYICSACSKEFAYLCNLQQHQKDLHPSQNCTYTEVENGKLRPQNHNGPVTVNREMSAEDGPSSNVASNVKKEDDLDDSTEELYTTIKIMASEGGKPKAPNVRLGINQHYPSFKPPPFPYHNRTPAGSVASATNFTTHNIPQTFTTAIRCTKCGRSFDNMPELHKHILACANASDKKRYTPKKNPIPLKEFAKAQNGVLSPTTAAAANAGQNTFRRMGLSKRLNLNQDPSSKVKLNAFIPRKNQLAQKAILQRNKQSLIAKRSSVKVEEQLYVCPHCNREFTYRGSLNKHVALSCSMKPVSKKSKKVKAASISVSLDRNGNLRRRTADSEIKQQGPALVPKTLGKTRARSSGPGTAVPLKPQPSKGKMAVQAVQLKRPASLPAALVPFSKKSKAAVNSSALMLQPSPALPPVLPLVPMRSQRGEPDPPKRLAEGNLPSQPKKEERLAVMARVRAGGPVTRSLQLANSKAPAMAEGEMSN